MHCQGPEWIQLLPRNGAKIGAEHLWPNLLLEMAPRQSNTKSHQVCSDEIQQVIGITVSQACLPNFHKLRIRGELLVFRSGPSAVLPSGLRYLGPAGQLRKVGR